MIAGVVVAKNPIDALKLIEKENAELYEIRVDSFETLKQMDILRSYSSKIIFTVRSASEGGLRKISEDERLRIYQRLIRLYPAYVDVELNASISDEIIKLARDNGVRVILSYHNFNETPPVDKLRDIAEKAKRKGADVVKIVSMANSIRDNIKVIQLYENNENLVAFCMGKWGKISRIFSVFLAPFTYAAINRATAPGQISVEELSELVRRFQNDKF